MRRLEILKVSIGLSFEGREYIFSAQRLNNVRISLELLERD